MATVLVVDDQDIVRDVIVVALESAGHDVVATASPLEGVELARAHPVDVLVSDVVMPELDAFELAARIRAERPSVAVLYMSGYADARGEGAFLQKPFTPAELVAAVNDLLQQR